MPQPVKISAEETRKRVKAGSALLVCAYDDDEKFQNNHLEGAISLGEFKTRLPSLPQDQEMIFYCA